MLCLGLLDGSSKTASHQTAQIIDVIRIDHGIVVNGRFDHQVDYLSRSQQARG